MFYFWPCFANSIGCTRPPFQCCQSDVTVKNDVSCGNGGSKYSIFKANIGLIQASAPKGMQEKEYHECKGSDRQKSFLWVSKSCYAKQ